MTLSSSQEYLTAIGNREWCRRLGRVLTLSGTSIEARGPEVVLGEICEVLDERSQRCVQTEVVGIKPDRIVLMPYGDLLGVGGGDAVCATGKGPSVPVGDGLLGRVIDAFGRPLDGGPPLVFSETRSVLATSPNPLDRPPIEAVLETGVKAIDVLLTLGKGQRVGIFAGSGVGKSTLLGMLARHVKSDISVIALIGERGREVREFIEKQLGDDGLRRSVVVVATSDQPALSRSRAAYTATTIAEYFRDCGKDVLLTMDSVTRFAMARREIGLAAGEPPTARGYTPSIFSEIPALCERCGTVTGGGSITALYTVLVEGDDMNEPVADVLRATLDGHIVLTRELAHQGHFPAIDVLKSTSRLSSEVTTPEHQRIAAALVELMACLDKNRSLVDLGVYQRGGNPRLDLALQLQNELHDFLRQSKRDSVSRESALSIAMQLAKKVH